MSDKLEKRLADLEEKVRRIENRNRGYLTQKLAAEYIGRSSEFLRERHACGNGPERMPNGMYSYQALRESLLIEGSMNRCVPILGRKKSRKNFRPQHWVKSMSKRNLKKGELKRILRVAGKHKRLHWKAMREAASTPGYTVQEADGHHYVHDGDNRVAGPFSNVEAWRWIDRHTVAKRYGQTPKE